jgi:hypothetical protein
MNPSTSDIPQHIRDWHALYESLTGLHISLDNFTRIDTWRTFIGFRKPPFTHDDLRVVVKRIKHLQLHANSKRSLKFHSLIGQPDYFEEDLAEARAMLRPRPPVEREVTYANTSRIINNPGTGDATRPVADVIAAMRAAVG